jgi:hypothetical protein
MQVGDLVIRKINSAIHWRQASAMQQREMLGMGIVLAKQMAGSPAHPCVTVFYPKVNKKYSIAEALLEVINASR